MKRKLLLVLTLAVSSPYLFGQQEVNSKTETPQNSTISATQTAQAPTEQIVSSADFIDRRIAAIDAKLISYEQNAEAKKKALADGTIDKLNKEKADLLVKKNNPAVASENVLKPAPVQNNTLSAGKQQPVETLEHLTSVINAIDSKVAYIKADKAENQKAIESGWFDMMAKQREILVLKKEALLKAPQETK